MDPFEQMVEARIREAIESGELRDLPGEGKPLTLDDVSAIPEELRAAYRILKNAGFLPPELQLRKELREAEQLLQQLPESERSRARPTGILAATVGGQSPPTDQSVARRSLPRILTGAARSG